METVKTGFKGLVKFLATIGGIIISITLGASFLLWGFRSDDLEHLNFWYVGQFLLAMLPYLGYLAGGIFALWACYQLVTLANRRLGITAKLAKLTEKVPVDFTHPLVVIGGIMAVLYFSAFAPIVLRYVIYAVIGGTLACKAWIKLTDDLLAKLEAKSGETEEEKQEQ